MKDENVTAIETLKIISDSISQTTRDLFRDENLRALHQLTESLHSITSPFDNIKSILDDVVASYKVPQLPDYISNKSTIDLISKQLSTFAYSELQGTSVLVDSVITALINTDYYSCVSAIANAVESASLSTVDFGFLKSMDLSHALALGFSIPSGLCSSLNSLNVGTANRLAKSRDITYDIKQRAFVTDSNPEVTATANEMNVISSGADLFDCIVDDEYITESELMNFMSYLQDSPTFASENPVGRKIIELINGVAEHINFDCNQYYHSRAREDGSIPFTFDEMLTAPSGVTGPGRYNHPGQAFYYFADTEDGSAVEVKKHNKGKIVQTAIIRPSKSINMIDLSGTIRRGQTFLKYIRFDATDGVMPKAYLIPCFVSDCCRALHIDGIKYYGSKEYSNYVCWNAGYFDFVSMI